MIVVDASVVVDLVCDRARATSIAERLLAEGDLHAPHLLDVEVASALRRLVAGGALNADRAADALVDAADLPVFRYPHRALLERAWELRERLTVADACYVALAELLELPLLTCDERLVRAGGHGARVELA